MTLRQFSVLILAVAPLLSAAQNRPLAVVIGNDTYPGHELKHSVNDASAIAESFRGLGFEVELVTDADRTQMQESLKRIRDRVTTSDVTIVVYFAGHGIQVNGEDYLVPVSAKIEHPSDVPQQTIALGTVFQALGAPRRNPNLIILDACRDNPFAGAFPDEWVPGLARPSGAPGNSLVAFATDPGNIASDGIGVHSPYTRALLRHIGRPGDSVEDFFKAVRKEVVANSDGFQTPWETSSLRAGLALRERAFLWGQIGGADDDAAVLVNGQQILDWNNDHGTRKQLLLEPGENDIVIQVFNQRSFTGGIPGIGGHLPEGWNYSVDLQMPDGTPFAHFHASEDQPEDNGPRHGKLFTVAHLKVSVEQITGRIVLLQRSELSLP